MTATLALFFLLSKIIPQPGVLAALGVEGTAAEKANHTAPPLAAALILTSLLPNVPQVKKLDAWILELFQTWGRIPSGIKYLADFVSYMDINIQKSDIESIRNWIDENADIPDELKKRVTDKQRDKDELSFTKLVKFYKAIIDLSQRPKYRKGFGSDTDAMKSLTTMFKIYSIESLAFYALTDQLEADQEVDAVSHELKEFRDWYRILCGKTQEKLSEFFATELLCVEQSSSAITTQIEKLGLESSPVFSVKKPIIFDPVFPSLINPGLPVGGFLLASVMLVAFILLLMSIVPLPANVEAPPPVLIALKIGLAQMLAIAIAIFPKLRFARFRPSKDKQPYLAWVVCAALAGITGLIIDRGTVCILQGTVDAALNFDKFHLQPTSIMAFSTALIVAVACDVDLTFGRFPYRRIADALAAAAVLALTIRICLVYLKLPTSTSDAAPAWLPYLIASCLGLSIGLIAPSYYRKLAGIGRQEPSPVSITAAGNGASAIGGNLGAIGLERPGATDSA
ncbi:hypothetical protein GCM10007874_50680 [Labrys miyagiensis]|uniref:Uncharacterized protein n=1 Tax=Labrys miyagiensis TaxID=346912 RepID=A0ABQ6CNZ3_9HYPH|nr:hypothetical protein GCM10007874_50680 [Labrys miyagiensis]